MLEITIDADVCKKDGLCAMTCTVAILEQEEKGTIPKVDAARLESCVHCGQCVAICPQGALSHSHFPEGTVHPIRSEYVPTYDHVLELFRSRRSKRAFKAKTVERDVIEKILDVARFGPSQHNEQSTEFVVIQDKETIREIGALTAKGLKKLVQPFHSAIGRMIMRRVLGARGAAYLGEFAPEMEGLADLYNGGRDLILREAPVLVLFCADSVGGTFAGTNANIALHNAALAAESLGLGCFYTGFVVTVSERDDSIARLIGLPETHQIYGALAMGYPRLKFNKWPERNPAKVTWVGADSPSAAI
jgi:nitroreductase/NAD-dependent dihydropyrimidine dehydrogenase PreA subunit